MAWVLVLVRPSSPPLTTICLDISAYARRRASHATLATCAAGVQCEESRVETGLAGRDPRPRMGHDAEAACPGADGAKVFANLGTGSLHCPWIGCGGCGPGTEAEMLMSVPCKRVECYSGFKTIRLHK